MLRIDSLCDNLLMARLVSGLLKEFSRTEESGSSLRGLLREDKGWRLEVNDWLVGFAFSLLTIWDETKF